MKNILCTLAKISMTNVEFARSVDCGDGRVCPRFGANEIREQVCLELNDLFHSCEDSVKVCSVAVRQNQIPRTILC